MKPESNEVSTENTDTNGEIKVTTPEKPPSTSQTPEAESAGTEDGGKTSGQKSPKAESQADKQPEANASTPTAARANGSDPGEIPNEDASEPATPVADEADAEAEAAEETGTEETESEETSEASAESKRIAELEEKLATAESRAEEMFERLQRTTAEFQNSQRRREKQVLDQMDRANARLIERLLPVLDDFELAFRNVPEEFSTEENGWIAGLQQIEKKLRRVLEEEQVTAIDPSGEFDPNRHEAISSEPNDEVESGHIIETLRTGYEHKGRVMRPALVRVAL